MVWRVMADDRAGLYAKPERRSRSQPQQSHPDGFPRLPATPSKWM
jgi:hypothetical protein